MKTPQVGDRVRIPWGLDVLDGIVIRVDAGGAKKRAVVQVDLPGTSSEDDPVTVTLPVDTLQPADWWPDEKDPVGGWAVAANYERHVLAAIEWVLSEHSDAELIEENLSKDSGFDLLVATSRGKLAVVIKYFFRARVGTGKVRELGDSLRRAIEHSDRVQHALIVTNIDVGSRVIDQQIKNIAGTAIPVRSVRWQSPDDNILLDQKFEMLLEDEE